MKDRQIERLKRLLELRSSGALDPEDFERAKSKLLDQRSPAWIIVAIACVCAVAALAVAFGLMTGRQSAEGLRVAALPRPIRPRSSIVAKPLTVLPTPTPTVSPSPSYPRYISTIPKAFRGRWDEIVADKCDAREARFMMTADKFWNFEVETDVTRVKLLSPTDIDIDVAGYDEDMNQTNDSWMLRLAEGGKAITGRSGKPTYFRRCPQ